MRWFWDTREEPEPGMTRRRFLFLGGAAAGAAVASTLVPTIVVPTLEVAGLDPVLATSRDIFRQFDAVRAIIPALFERDDVILFPHGMLPPPERVSGRGLRLPRRFGRRAVTL